MLRTDRLLLRTLRLDDAQAIAAITNDLSVARWLVKAPHPYEIQHARALIERSLRPGPPVWGIDDGKLVGIVGLRGEFGFWIAKEVWGLGYATEAGKAVVDYGFTSLRRCHLDAEPFRDNIGSRRVLAKLGFRELGYSSVYSAGRRALVATVQTRLARTAWRKQQLRAQS